MGGFVSDKLNASRIVYFRGLEQELSFQIPLSGSKTKIDFNLNFDFNNNLNLNS
jgi:ribosome-associated toxin RatA of RatAB toxin-antitoxin module